MYCLAMRLASAIKLNIEFQAESLDHSNENLMVAAYAENLIVMIWSKLAVILDSNIISFKNSKFLFLIFTVC